MLQELPQDACSQVSFEIKPPDNLKIKGKSQVREFWDSQSQCVGGRLTPGTDVEGEILTMLSWGVQAEIPEAAKGSEFSSFTLLGKSSSIAWGQV
jgi:hypothetical protein